MRHPGLVLIPGKDLGEVEHQLQNIDIDYKINKDFNIKEKTQFLIRGYSWNNPNKIVYFNNIIKSLQLPFFKSEPVELEWDITSCFPQNWTFDNWKLETLDTDVKFWFSTDSNFKITKSDKELIAKIINKCIHQENEILRIYTETLKPTFLHPQIQTLLNYCMRHKEAHIKMWENVKEKFKLRNQSPNIIIDRFSADFFHLLVSNITELISLEEIVEPVATKWLTHFTGKSYVNKLFKLIQRRDKESKENAKLVEILLEEFGKMYPFMTNAINFHFERNRNYIANI